MEMLLHHAASRRKLFSVFCALSILLMNLSFADGSHGKSMSKIEIVKPLHRSAPDDPVAIFENVWLEHHVIEHGVKGMRIHAKFIVKNRFNVPCNLIPFFSSKGGAPLNQPYNEVFASVSFTPRYDSSEYADKSFFLPYKKFNFLQRGVYDLKLHLGVASEVRRNGKSEYLNIGTSEYVYFTYTKS
jgi:hypothetical protein